MYTSACPVYGDKTVILIIEGDLRGFVIPIYWSQNLEYTSGADQVWNTEGRAPPTFPPDTVVRVNIVFIFYPLTIKHAVLSTNLSHLGYLE